MFFVYRLSTNQVEKCLGNWNELDTIYSTFIVLGYVRNFNKNFDEMKLREISHFNELGFWKDDPRHIPDTGPVKILLFLIDEIGFFYSFLSN